MCLIAIAWQLDERQPFLLISNRDEFYKRPTETTHFWKDHPQILAGKDLQAGGTWMGMSTSGRFAAITNIRHPNYFRPAARSRGELPIQYLSAHVSETDFEQYLIETAALYNGYNFLFGDLKKEKLLHFNSEEKKVVPLAPGIYGLSNASLNTPWPKVERVKHGLEEWLADNSATDDELMALMRDTQLAPDEKLPSTGVPTELEKALSAVCIRLPDYGTRNTTLIKLNNKGHIQWKELIYRIPEQSSISKFFEFHLE